MLLLRQGRPADVDCARLRAQTLYSEGMISAETKQQRRIFRRKADLAVLPVLELGTIVLNLGTIPVPDSHWPPLRSKTQGGRKKGSRYTTRHRPNGERECARRRRQIAKGMIDAAQMLA